MEATSVPNEGSKVMLSIIIPFYNVEKYIAECLESAISQTFPHIEIICVDDNGTDNTASIIQEFAKTDSRIRVVRNEKNLGVAASRNVGVRHSRSPYIMFLDSDDTYELTMCEKMVEAIESSGADVAMCGTQISYERDESLKESDDAYFSLKYKGLHNVSDELIASCDVSLWNKIFRKEIIEKYDIRFPDGLRYEDAFFYQAYMAQANSIVFVNEKLYHYRRREGSIMNLTFAKSSSAGLEHLLIIMRLHDYFLRWNLQEKKYVHFCRLFVQYMGHAICHSSSQEERHEVLKTAADFARKHLKTTSGLDYECASQIERYKYTSPLHRSKGLLLHITEKPFSKRYSVLGIPVYKIRYSPSFQKHYLFGIQIYRKRNICS